MSNRPQRNQFPNNESFQRAMRNYKGKSPVTNGSFNNVPKNMYPEIARHMNAKQLAQLASASLNFRTWVQTRPNLMGKIKAGRYQSIVTGNKLLPGNLPRDLGNNGLRAPNSNLNFLRKYNIPKWRAQAYLRGTLNPGSSGGTSTKLFPGEKASKNYNVRKNLIGIRSFFPGERKMRIYFNNWNGYREYMASGSNTNRKGRPTKSGLRLVRLTQPSDYRNQKIAKYYGGKWLNKVRKRLAR